MRAPAAHRRRGFTLAELTVSLAVTATVMGMVMGTVITQQKGFQNSEVGRKAIEGGRDAILELEHTLRRAGFGVDPRFAFDFAYYRCRFATNTSGRPNSCRDRAFRQGFNDDDVKAARYADQLVFFSRNPAYRFDANGQNGCSNADGCLRGAVYRIKAGSSDAINTRFKLEAVPAGRKLYRGQVLLILCRNVPSRYTLVTVNTPVTFDGADATVELYPTGLAPTGRVGLATNPYRENALFAADAPTCYNSGNGLAYEVDLFRYFIRRDPSGRPWLMLDRGLNTKDDDTTDPWIAATGADPDANREPYLEPISANVEDLQIAYQLSAPSTGAAPPDIPGPNFPNGTPVPFRSDGTIDSAALDPPIAANWVIGDSSMNPLDASRPDAPFEEPDVLADAPRYNTPGSDNLRGTLHPANIRAVRVGLVIRGDARLNGYSPPNAGTTLAVLKEMDVLPPLENRAWVHPRDGYPRQTVRTTITVRNMTSRGLAVF